MPTITELNIEITETCADPEENYIFLRANYMDQKVLLGSIYGPNGTGREFYRRISRIINKSNNFYYYIFFDFFISVLTNKI